MWSIQARIIWQTARDAALRYGKRDNCAGLAVSSHPRVRRMEGRTLRVRAPVNYKAEASGTNTPGWLKSKTTTRVFSEEQTGVPAKPDTDKENKTQDHKHAKKLSPESAGKTRLLRDPFKLCLALCSVLLAEHLSLCQTLSL